MKTLCLISVLALLLSGFSRFDFISRADIHNRPSVVAEPKPNVIIILADQWRAQSTGYGGNTDVMTPNLDRLAAQSVVFNTAVAVMPVCTPYRASLMTGQYPLTHGVFYNDKPLPNKAVTMGELFKQAGYQTGFIGKWHLNGHQNGEPMFSARDKPVPKNRRQGFDYWKVREVTHDYNDSYYFDENDRKQFWQGYDAFPQTDSAIAFVKSRKNNPFLLVLSWGPPHNPYQTAPQAYRDLYKGKPITVRPNVPEPFRDSTRKVLANYYAHCTALDKAAGDLLDALQREGLADNTIVVFTSDHGDMLLSRGVFRKQRPWDESIRVPMLIRYPAQLGTEKRVIDRPINTPDILPTLLGLSNLPIPESVEGHDFSGALVNRKTALLPDAALIMLPVPFHEWNFMHDGREYRGIRTERYTYARDLTGPWLLYDNQADPYQLQNLIGKTEHKAIQTRLDKRLTTELRQRKDAFLPADAYMKQWNYRYDEGDSLRPAAYYKNRSK